MEQAKKKSETQKKAEPQLVDAVARALEILDCFSKYETEQSLNQLCDKTGMYKSRVHRLCGTLMATGYLVKTSRSNYRLGPKLMVLGKVYENSNTLRSIAEPFMKKLSSETGQSTALFALDGMKCMCMAREVGTGRLVYSISEGDSMELARTASGRIFLAYAEESFVDRVFAKATREAENGGREFDENEARAALVSIRENGYALNNRSIEEGTAALASPIFDFNHDVAAALAIVGPVHRFKDELIGELITLLITATGDMSRLAGEA